MNKYSNNNNNNDHHQLYNFNSKSYQFDDDSDNNDAAFTSAALVIRLAPAISTLLMFLTGLLRKLLSDNCLGSLPCCCCLDELIVLLPPIAVVPLFSVEASLKVRFASPCHELCFV